MLTGRVIPGTRTSWESLARNVGMGLTEHVHFFFFFRGRLKTVKECAAVCLIRIHIYAGNLRAINLSAIVFSFLVTKYDANDWAKSEDYIYIYIYIYIYKRWGNSTTFQTSLRVIYLWVK